MILKTNKGKKEKKRKTHLQYFNFTENSKLTQAHSQCFSVFVCLFLFCFLFVCFLHTRHKNCIDSILNGDIYKNNNIYIL